MLYQKTKSKSVFFVGDIALSGDIRLEDLDLFCTPFNPIREEGDLLFANLEIPITPENTSPVHVCNASILETGLKRLGVTHVNLANNHILDGGREGVARTIDLLDRLNIKHTGAGTKPEHCAPVVLDWNDKKVALLGYVLANTHIKNYPSSDVFVNVWEPEMARHEIQKWRADGYEVWVSLHWGEDYSHCAEPNQIRIADDIAEWGGSLIIGHHAHVVQPMQERARTVVFFGLGGYVFGHFWKNNQWCSLFKKTKQGLIVQLKLASDGSKTFHYYRSLESWNHQVRIKNWNYFGWSSCYWALGQFKHSHPIIKKLFTIFELLSCKILHQASRFGTNQWSQVLRRINKVER
jgi:hypothetical protein